MTLKSSLTAAAIAAACLAAAPLAHANTTFVFTDVGTTAMTTVQLNAFKAAGDYWSSQLTDNVTIYVNIAFNNLGAGILGSTGSTFTTADYSTVRSALISDAKSGIDATAVSSLQAGPALSFMATQGDLTTRFDNDGSVNNTLLGLTTANAKALGLSTTTNAANPDARITFATGFANSFVYTRFCAGPANQCGLPNTAGRFETDWWYEPLDLFRYSAPGTLDVTVGGTKYFSVDGGATSIESFSTGTEHGNGWQASHFGPNVQTLMRPFVGNGQSYDASAADLAAFDAIGWDIAAVPEPGTYALMFAGLAVVGSVAKRRRQQA